MPVDIKKPHLLLVEGRTDYHFFDELFKKIGLANVVQIIVVDGKTNFTHLLSMLLTQPQLENDCLGWSQVQALALVRDANGDFKASFTSACDSLKSCGLPSPNKPAQFTVSNKIKTGIYILPDNKSNGALEDLFLQLQKNDKRMECVDKFLGCVNDLCKSDKNIQPPKNTSKAKARAYLSSLAEDTAHISYALANDAINVSSPALQPLIQFVTNLSKA